MFTFSHLLAGIGILASIGSIIAQLVYLRAQLYDLHHTATCALAAAVILCTISVAITLTITLP